MKKFVKIPNLPTGKVNTAVIGKIDDRLYAFINKYVKNIIICDENTNIDKSISCHADINIHHLGGDAVILDKSQTALKEKLENLGMKAVFSSENVCGAYPNDCVLNFARVGKLLFGREDICSSELKRYAEENGFKTVNVRQGYCKCSVCAVTESAIITDDPSVKKAAGIIGLDCLLISKGGVRLMGHEYGFIGGASAKIDNNTVIFFGDITKHSDGKRIVDFIEKHGCKAVYLPEYRLTDIGGMIPLVTGE